MTTPMVLGNGVTVVFRKSERKRTAIVIGIDAGSAAELPGEYGAAHFLEHACFRGSSRYPDGSTKALMAFGGDANAFTSVDATVFETVTAMEAAPKAIRALFDTVFHPTLDPHKLKKERGVIVNEVKSYEDDAMSTAQSDMDAIMYPGSGYGRRISGTVENVKKLSTAKLRAFHERNYCGGNVVIVVSGGIDNLVQSAVLGAAAKIRRAPSFPDPCVVTQRREPSMVTIEDQVQQYSIKLTYPMGTASPDLSTRAAFTVMQEILCSGATSRLFAAVRDQHGLAYAIHGGYAARKHAHEFAIYAATDSAGNVKRVRKLVDTHIRKLLAGDIEAAEIAYARNSVVGQILAREDDIYASAVATVLAMMQYRRIEVTEHVLDRVRAVTKAKVVEAARTCFQNPPSVTMVVPKNP